MTEDAGFPPEDAGELPEPAESAGPVEPAEAPGLEPAAPAEEAPAVSTPGDEPVEAVSATAGAPDPVLPPYVPDGQPEWFNDLVTGLHDRLRALGG